MTTEELVVKISASTGDFTSKMDDVDKKIQNVGNNSGDSGQKLKGAFKGAATTVAAGATAIAGAGVAVFGFADKIATTGDEIDKQSQKLGVSAEQYQTLAYAAEHSGFSMSAFTAAQKTLLKTNPSANIYDELNALMAIEDPAKRSAAACKQFGIKAGTEMAALLNGDTSLDDYRNNLDGLGGLMSNDMVSNSAAFKDGITDVQAAFSGAGASLLTELMPQITDLMNKITEFINNGGLQKIVDTFNAWLPVITGVTGALIAYKIAMAISGAIAAFQAATQGATIAQAAFNLIMNANPIVLIVTLIVGLVVAVITLWKTNDKFREKVKKVWEVIKKAFTTAVDGIKNTLTGMKEKITNIFNTVKTKVTTVVSNIKNGIINGFSKVKQRVENIFNKVKEAISKPIDKAKELISKAVGGIKKIFKKFKISLPHINLPHFSLKGGKAPFGLGGKGSLPKLSIDWYAKGGVFDSPSVIGVGEAGQEAVMPLERNTGWIDTLAEKLEGRMGGNNDGRPLSITLQVDKQRLGKVTISSINDIINQEGIIPLAI